MIAKGIKGQNPKQQKKKPEDNRADRHPREFERWIVDKIAMVLAEWRRKTAASCCKRSSQKSRSGSGTIKSAGL